MGVWNRSGSEREHNLYFQGSGASHAVTAQSNFRGRVRWSFTSLNFVCQLRSVTSGLPCIVVGFLFPMRDVKDALFDMVAQRSPEEVIIHFHKACAIARRFWLPSLQGKALCNIPLISLRFAALYSVLRCWKGPCALGALLHSKIKCLPVGSDWRILPLSC